NFTDNILLDVGTSNTVIQGNKIGTDITGTQSLQLFFGHYGVELESSSDNTIGGSAMGEGNLISGNAGDGIFMGSGSQNIIQGNLIGTDITRTQPLPNGENFLQFLGIGIEIESSSDNTVGGTTPGARNIVSGNTFAGVFDAGDHDLVEGNYLGTNAAGTAAILVPMTAFQTFGIAEVGTNDTVGGTVPGAGNLISGDITGMQLDGTGNVAEGNLIGTDFSGTTVVGNSAEGVRFISGSANLLGGTTAATRNVISGRRYGSWLWKPDL